MKLYNVSFLGYRVDNVIYGAEDINALCKMLFGSKESVLRELLDNYSYTHVITVGEYNYFVTEADFGEGLIFRIVE